MNIYKKDGYIFIEVNNHFTYDINISRIPTLGSEKDSPSVYSLWGLINHLRDKNWWHLDLERSLIKLYKEITID